MTTTKQLVEDCRQAAIQLHHAVHVYVQERRVKELLGQSVDELNTDFVKEKEDIYRKSVELLKEATKQSNSYTAQCDTATDAKSCQLSIDHYKELSQHLQRVMDDNRQKSLKWQNECESLLK